MKLLTEIGKFFILTAVLILISGCSLIMPRAAKTEFLHYKTKAELRLPFDGLWYVYWGGEDIKDNYHAASSAQRFALDFVKIDQNTEPEKDVIRSGQTHFGDGTTNRQFYAYGQTIVAPGNGKIIEVVNNLPDERPGKRRSNKHFGNHVIIDHGNKEFSFLAHLQPNSIVVQKGDYVQAGDKIGLCGNSGMSTEPHLHYHMQNSPIPNTKGSGLPIQFKKYQSSFKDGELVHGQMPRKKEMVQHYYE